jgi:hypothetical protein
MNLWTPDKLSTLAFWWRAGLGEWDPILRCWFDDHLRVRP